MTWTCAVTEKDIIMLLMSAISIYWISHPGQCYCILPDTSAYKQISILVLSILLRGRHTKIV